MNDELDDNESSADDRRFPQTEDRDTTKTPGKKVSFAPSRLLPFALKSARSRSRESGHQRKDAEAPSRYKSADERRFSQLGPVGLSCQKFPRNSVFSADAFAALRLRSTGWIPSAICHKKIRLNRIKSDLIALNRTCFETFFIRNCQMAKNDHSPRHSASVKPGQGQSNPSAFPCQTFPCHSAISGGGFVTGFALVKCLIMKICDGVTAPRPWRGRRWTKRANRQRLKAN